MSSDEQSFDVKEDDEQVLARRIRQLIIGHSEIGSDQDTDELVRRKIKERLEDEPCMSTEERPCNEPASNVDLFGDSDDAFSESTQLNHARTGKRSNTRAELTFSSSSSSSRSRDRNERKRRRPHNRIRLRRKPEDTKAAETIYSELQEIHRTMQAESAALKAKEEDLLKREEKLHRAEEMYAEVLENEKREWFEEIESAYQRDLDQLNELHREKCRENKRLRENFDSIKTANDTLKGQLETLTGRHEKLERQSASLQARLTNLQRIATHTHSGSRTPVLQNVPAEKENSETKPKPKVKVPASSIVEVMSVLLEWLAEAQMKEVTRAAVKCAKEEITDNQSMDRAVKILPNLADLLRDGVPQGCRIDLPCLQFIYWSYYRMEQIPGMNRSTLSSTMRRFGDEFYRSKTLKFENDPIRLEAGERLRGKGGRFFHSDHLQERFLSSLIILKALNQADIVAHVLDSVKIDLKDNVCKEMFIHYKAMNVLLSFFKPANQSLLSSTCDVLLQLSMESRILDEFLKACSTETWFRQCAVVLKSPGVDRKIVEKLSVVLQKLSKIKTNCRLLDTYGITSAVQDLLRNCHDEYAFLALNLKSIQYNLQRKS